MKNIACSWSGGKDSCYALMLAKAMGYVPVVLLNIMNENGRISRSHGLSLEILNSQAREAGLPLVTIPSTWEQYEKNFIHILKQMKSEYHFDAMVFGDIDIQAHRIWEEKVCREADIEAILPLWKKDRNELAVEIIAAGVESMIVSCNSHLGEEFLGKIYDIELIKQLHHSAIDACGENGEFHSLVINCPLFKDRIHISEYTKHTHRDYCFIDWNI